MSYYRYADNDNFGNNHVDDIELEKEYSRVFNRRKHQMIITVLNVSETTKKATNGKPFSQLEVAYKDENGKVSAKKLMSFSFPEAYNVLKAATANQVFEIQSEKNEKSGYWDWVKAMKTDKVNEVQTDPDQPSKSSAKTSTYNDPRETKEERAWRQVLIVRQSCLAQAVSLAIKDPKDGLDYVLSIAEEFESWVMRKPTGTEDLISMEDDIKF